MDWQHSLIEIIRGGNMASKRSLRTGSTMAPLHNWSSTLIRNLGHRIAYRIGERRFGRKIWSFGEGNVSIIVSVGVGTTEALARVVSLLGRLVRRECISVSLEKAAPDGWRSENLVLLGGPQGNAITGEVLKQLEGSLDFTFDGTTLRLNGEPYRAKKTEKGQVETDYGIIMKAQSPFSPQRMVFVAAGCNLLGTYAGAALLSMRSSMGQLSAHYGTGPFQVSFEVQAFDEDLMSKSIRIVSPCELRGMRFANPGPGRGYDVVAEVKRVVASRPVWPSYLRGVWYSSTSMTQEIEGALEENGVDYERVQLSIGKGYSWYENERLTLPSAKWYLSSGPYSHRARRSILMIPSQTAEMRTHVLLFAPDEATVRHTAYLLERQLWEKSIELTPMIFPDGPDFVNTAIRGGVRVAGLRVATPNGELLTRFDASEDPGICAFLASWEGSWRLVFLSLVVGEIVTTLIGGSNRLFFSSADVADDDIAHVVAELDHVVCSPQGSYSDTRGSHPTRGT